MKQFHLQQNYCKELFFFPHIIEFAFKKNSTIHLNSFNDSATVHPRIFYITEGKFDWVIEGRHHMLYPGDLAIILPNQVLGSEKKYLDIGSLYWFQVQINFTVPDHEHSPAEWSGLSKNEQLTIEKVLLLNKTPVISGFKKASGIFQSIQTEIFNQELGYVTRVNQLIDELFIFITRQLTRQNISQRDFPQTFMQLEQTLRQNLSHQWTVEEMAALVGLGITAFSEKVKTFTGFSPLNYLINIRISEAIRKLKRHDMNLTDIALGTGFYSSQHFSTTFKKLTGYTPSQFRRR
ncbi:MAG TPA: helix-turn-helix domain-containing protein [Agriterribacter sp.]|nr:helix-turn-helix domain-containing protein [Agriterribacter sp.]